MTRRMMLAGTAHVAFLLSAGAVQAQEPVASTAAQQLYMSRADLLALVDFYERSVQSPAYSERLRQRAVFLREVVQARLTDGDYQVGDRVIVIVEGPVLTSDTLVVGQDRTIRYPQIGDLPVGGVLRSELQGVLQQYLDQYLRNPRVVAQSLIRIQLSGAVAAPGFYTMPSEIPLPDAIMRAGGPAGDVDLAGIRIERRGRKLIYGDRLQEALAAGRTLDQLNLQGGDMIFFPETFPLGSAESAIRTVGMLLAIPGSIIALIALIT